MWTKDFKHVVQGCNINSSFTDANIQIHGFEKSEEKNNYIFSNIVILWWKFYVDYYSQVFIKQTGWVNMLEYL